MPVTKTLIRFAGLFLSAIAGLEIYLSGVFLDRPGPPVILVVGLLLVYYGTRKKLPTQNAVDAVAEHIREARNRGVQNAHESHKANLRFYFPPEWKTKKLGKEAHILYPQGLGAVEISICAFDEDPEFQDRSLDGLESNASDLVRRQGLTLIFETVKPTTVAGPEGIYFKMTRRNRECAEAYFWHYEGGDYLVLIEAQSKDHLLRINPATHEFLCGLFMW